MTCDIELGKYESTSKGVLVSAHWCWTLVLPDCRVQGDKDDYCSKASAVRGAKVRAARFGLKVLDVYVAGEEPD